tara:strand:- start:10 stop:258 length:249 start_codon:yes stop_codon:yes gene_type:complete
LIQLNANDSLVEIHIEDSGIGLKQHQLETVFKPFYCVENSRSRTTGATGLGLTIAKEIIQLHEGQIKLKNRGLCRIEWKVEI